MRRLIQFILITSLASCSPDSAKRTTNDSGQTDAVEGLRPKLDTVVLEGLASLPDSIPTATRQEVKPKIKSKTLSLEDEVTRLRNQRLQVIELDVTADNEIELNEGTVLMIPRTAIIGYTAPRIEVLEVYKFSDIILNRLTTVTRNDELLGSFGMIEIELFDGVDTVKFTDAYEVYFPATNVSEKPILFTGTLDGNSIRWQTPNEEILEFYERIQLTVGEDLLSRDLPFVGLSPFPLSRVDSLFKYVSERLFLTYQEKVEFFNFLKSSNVSQSGPYYAELGFQVGNIRENKRIQCAYPRAIRNKVEPIIRDYINNYNPSFSAKTKLLLQIVEKSYQDSIDLRLVEERNEYLRKLRETDYFAYFTLSQGWLNCDYYMRNRMEKPKKLLIAKNNLSPKARVYAKLGSIRALVELAIDNSRDNYYSTNLIPEGQSITFIIVDEKNSGYHLSVGSLGIDRPEVVDNYQLEKVTFKELQNRLDNI